MKKLFVLCIVSLLLVSCVQRNEFGPCVGFADKENPNLDYDLSFWNIFMGLLFSETIIVPVVVAAKEYECPVATRK